MEPDGANDGILIQAWSPETVDVRAAAVSRHFAFSRENGLAVDITPATVRASLRICQTRCEAGERRVGGVAGYLDQLTAPASAVRPERSWGRLRAARDRLKKIARNHASRNVGRVVDVVELRLAALGLMRSANRLRRRARTRRQRVSAHTVARTALAAFLLSEAPLRIGSLVGIEIGRRPPMPAVALRMMPRPAATSPEPWRARAPARRR